MQQQYTVIKELKSPIKLTSRLYLFDIGFILGYMMMTYALKILVHPIMQPFYFAFSLVMAVILTSHPPKNPQKRVFHLVLFWLLKDRYSYHAVSIPPEQEEK